MNLIEHYIKEVHGVRVVTQDWGEFVMVDMTTDSYGCIERRETMFPSIDEWEAVRVLGYFMA